MWTSSSWVASGARLPSAPAFTRLAARLVTGKPQLEHPAPPRLGPVAAPLSLQYRRHGKAVIARVTWKVEPPEPSPGAEGQPARFGKGGTARKPQMDATAFSLKDKAAVHANLSEFQRSRLTGREVDVTSGNIQLLASLKGVSNPKALDYLGSHDEIETDVKRDLSGICLAAATLVGYISVGVVAFSYVLGDWDVSDSLWFTLTTLTTVGYGDLVPNTPELKVFTILYILAGACITASALGVVLASVAHSLTSHLEASEDEQRARSLEILSQALIQQAEVREARADPQKSHPSAPAIPLQPSHSSLADSHAELRPSFILVRELVWLTSLLIAGGCCVHFLEPESFPSVLDGIYFASVTMSTVGFGDIVPQTEIARILTVLLVPLAVFAFAQSAESIAESFEMAAIRAREKQLMMKPLDLGDLLRMDLDKNGA